MNSMRDHWILKKYTAHDYDFATVAGSVRNVNIDAIFEHCRLCSLIVDPWAGRATRAHACSNAKHIRFIRICFCYLG